MTIAQYHAERELIFTLADEELDRSLGDSYGNLSLEEYTDKMKDMMVLVELSLEKLPEDHPEETFRETLWRIREELGISI